MTAVARDAAIGHDRVTSRADSRRTTQRSEAAPTTASPFALIVTELALLTTSIALVYGFSRLFVDRSFFWRLAGFATVSHATAAGVRRLGRGIIVATIASLIGLAITIGVVLYRSTTRALLPTWATRDAGRTDLQSAWKVFTAIRTPVPVHPGFVLGACLAMWAVAFLADWAAFRIWSPFEALAPGAVVFIFCSLESAEKQRLSSTFAYAGTALFFLLVHRALRIDRTASWLAAEPENGRRAVVRTGVLVAIVAVVVGGVIGPALPGSDAGAALAWRRLGKGNQESPSRVTISPLVTIRSRLVSLANVEAFTVKADQPDYWRLTSLDQFDGSAWTSSGEYETAKGTLPSQLPDGTSTQSLAQTFTIEALDPPWMPAAYEPVSVVLDGGTKAIYESESATLTIGNKVTSGEGKTYTIESRVPVRDVNVLRAATDSAVPQAIRDRYAVAPSLTGFVRSRATQATRNTTTPFDRALALQNFFRNGSFTYSLDVAAGQGVDSIDSFLRRRVGYCEQYASAYAAMARSLGLPARVAVGFTPGDQDANGLWHVRGEYAHAWPEVYLAGAGWVRFEPTPGRGAPGDQSYTGVPFQQVAPGAPTSATTVPATTTTVAGTTPTTSTPDSTAAVDPGSVAQGTAPGARLLGSTTLLGAIVRIALGLLGALVLATLAVPTWKVLRRAARRRRIGNTARGQVAVAWEEAVDALGLLRLPVSPAATPTEIADDASRTAPKEAGEALHRLATMTTEARYAPIEPDADTVARAATAATLIQSTIRAHVSRGRRIRQMLDPRPLFPGTTITAK